MSGNVIASNKALVDIDFIGTDASEFPAGYWLAGVLSVAGANGTTMSGMTYQNPFFLFQNESVMDTTSLFGRFPMALLLFR